MNLTVDSEVPGVEDERGESDFRPCSFVEARGLVHIFAAGDVSHSGVGLVGDVDRDEVLFSGATAEISENAVGRAVPHPLSFALLERGMSTTEGNQLFVQREEVWAALGNLPEDGKL